MLHHERYVAVGTANGLGSFAQHGALRAIDNNERVAVINYTLADAHKGVGAGGQLEFRTGIGHKRAAGVHLARERLVGAGNAVAAAVECIDRIAALADGVGARFGLAVFFNGDGGAKAVAQVHFLRLRLGCHGPRGRLRGFKLLFGQRKGGVAA